MRTRWAVGFLLAAPFACHESHRGGLGGVAEAFARGDDVGVVTALTERAECTGEATRADPRACIDALARAFGGTNGFSAARPDDASLGALAVWLTRSQHGELVPGAETWLAAIAGAVGPGADMLRLAVAGTMAVAAGTVRKGARDAAHARAFAAAVARAVPGASASGSAKEAGALWVRASQALDLGQDRMTGAARVALGRRMGIVRVATAEIEAREWEGDAGWP